MEEQTQETRSTELSTRRSTRSTVKSATKKNDNQLTQIKPSSTEKTKPEENGAPTKRTRARKPLVESGDKTPRRTKKLRIDAPSVSPPVTSGPSPSHVISKYFSPEKLASEKSQPKKRQSKKLNLDESTTDQKHSKKKRKVATKKRKSPDNNSDSDLPKKRKVEVENVEIISIGSSEASKESEVESDFEDVDDAADETEFLLRNEFKSIFQDSDDKKSDSKSKKKKAKNSKNKADELSDDDWERVDDADIEDETDLDSYKPDLPSGGVDIILEGQVVTKKTKKKQHYLDVIRQRINKYNRELQLAMHKTHLVCLIARGAYLARKTLNGEICSLALSCFPAFKHTKLDVMDLTTIKKLVFWYTKEFTYDPVKAPKSAKRALNTDCRSIDEKIVEGFSTRSIRGEAEYVLIFLAILRIHFSCQFRLIYALNPVPIKPKGQILSDKQKALLRKAKDRVKAAEKKTKKSNRKKVISSDSEDSVIAVSSTKSKKSNDEHEDALEYWLEIFSAAEKRWISVDLTSQVIDDTKHFGSKSYKNLFYVIAFNERIQVKDVSSRYSTKMLLNKDRSFRVKDDWWAEALSLYRPKKISKQEKEEDEQILNSLSEYPLPDKASDYKNHPLYALKRHLLKYEVIYPPDAPSLGYFQEEPVYARECVKDVHAEIFWKKLARVVKEGESPYKIYMQKRRWNRLLNNYEKDVPQNLYGYWQTEDFVPEEARDGKVPRNRYGNVELFQECMLPKGTVYLKLPGLVRIANKLKIDCVPAMVGFDHRSLPVLEGYVVCKEHEEILVNAWNEQQDIDEKRRDDKVKKRVIKNWTRLVKAFFIKEKIKSKYKVDDHAEVDVAGDELIVNDVEEMDTETDID